jgi:hypothetical protein
MKTPYPALNILSWIANEISWLIWNLVHKNKTHR